tara:strand:- start:7239 stop:7994 length:756 start_codon:yes stop_codon:yes gene_type:complete
MLKILLLVSFLLPMTGLELAQKMEERPKPNDLKSENTMILINKKGREKTSKLISKSKDDSKKQMIWFLEPKDDYGIAFLKIEYDNDDDDYMNMWLPGFNKFRRISSQKKSDSFMGSDLSFEDLTNRDINEYDFTIIEKNVTCNEAKEEKNCYKLMSVPKEIDSEYSYHITWVTKDNFLSVKEESFDKNKELLKKKSIEFNKIDKYYIMSKLFVHNVQKNHRTSLIMDKISINLGYTDNIFHTKNLKRVPLD